MGLFNSVKDFFKTDGEKKKELRELRHSLKNKAENAISNIDTIITPLNKEKANVWKDAIQAVAAGQTTEAKLILQKFRLLDFFVYQFERHKLFMQNYLLRAQMAEEVIFNDSPDIAFSSIDSDLMNKDSSEEYMKRITEETEEVKSLKKFVDDIISFLNDTDNSKNIPDIDSLFSSLQKEMEQGDENVSDAGSTQSKDAN